MTEPHKRPYRHPKYKIAYRVKNWREYEQSLRDRGDITLWISQDAIDAWTPPQTGKRGAQPVYSDVAIETALSLRLLFHLPLRQTEGFLGSVLTLMDLALPCPDHTRVVYLGSADKYCGPFASRLTGVTRPSIHTRKGFSASHPAQLACICAHLGRLLPRSSNGAVS